jgi:hypothetical protein
VRQWVGFAISRHGGHVKLEALSKGQHVTIKGKCDGLMGMVEMSQCSLQ